jgi:integrase
VKKIPNLLIRKNASGKDTFQFKPTRHMRAAGFNTVSYGTNREQAYADVERYNAEWGEMKAAKAALEAPDAAVARTQAQTVAWLVDRFQHDVTYYRKKSKRTREEYDQMFAYFMDAGFGEVAAAAVERQHLRVWHGQLIDDRVSTHKIAKCFKCIRRLFEYGLLELKVVNSNPLHKFGEEKPVGRKTVWHSGDVAKIIAASRKEPELEEFAEAGQCRNCGAPVERLTARPRLYCSTECRTEAATRKRYLNKRANRPYPSVGLAVAISVTTSLPQQDILAMQWNQYDGQAFTVRQIKKRGDFDLYIPLTPEIIDELDAMLARGVESTHIIVYEGTGRPYRDKNQFGRTFRIVRDRAGVTPGVTFQDLRTTALTKLASKSATNAEIVSFSGHAVNSPILKEYIMQTKEAALNARRKMGNYLTDENESETTAEQEGRQRGRQGRQTPEGVSSNPLYLLRKNGGSDGT